MVTPDRIAFTIPGVNLPIYWYGIIMTLAVVLGYFFTSREAKRRGLDTEVILDLALWMIPTGVVGARLYSVLAELPIYVNNPLDVFNLRLGGLSIFGALIACFIVLIFFCKKKKISMPVLLDVLAPAVVISQALGRWGNFFNQEVFGLQVLNPDMQFFPFAVYITEPTVLVPGIPGWFLALFFYESVWNLFTFIVLYVYSRKPRRPGNTFLLYVIMYSVMRSFLEWLRVETFQLSILKDITLIPGFSGIPVSFLTSVGLALVAIVLMAVRGRRPFEPDAWRFAPQAAAEDEAPVAQVEGEAAVSPQAEVSSVATEDPSEDQACTLDAPDDGQAEDAPKQKDDDPDHCSLT